MMMENRSQKHKEFRQCSSLINHKLMDLCKLPLFTDHLQRNQTLNKNPIIFSTQYNKMEIKIYRISQGHKMYI